MFPLNGGGSGPLVGRPMQPNPMQARPAMPGPAPQMGQPQAGPVQSPAAQAIAIALQAILREGLTPPVQTALEGFFLTLQKIHQSASPAPQGPPMGAEQMGFSALPNAAAHSAPQPGGRY